MSRKRKQQQTKLAFSALPDTSPAKQSQPEAIRSRVAGVSIDFRDGSRSRHNAKTRTSSRQAAAGDVMADRLIGSPNAGTSSSIIIVEPPKSAELKPLKRKGHHQGRESRSLRNRSGGTEDTGGKEKIHLSSSPPVAVTMQKELFSDEESRASVGEHVEDSNDEDEDDVVLPSARKRRKLTSPMPEQEPEPVTPAKSKSRFQAKAKRPLQRARRESSFINDENDDSDEGEVQDEESDRDSDFIQVLNGNSNTEENKSDDSDIIALTSARKKRPRDILQDKLDLDEDLEFLEPADNVEEEARTPRRNKLGSAKATKRTNALEELKRRREQRQGVSSSGPRSSDREEGNEDEISESADSSDSTEETNKTPSVISMMDVEDLDADMDDFVTPDDAGAEENEDIAMMKMETGLHKASRRVHFQIAAEWMLQKLLNPNFDPGKRHHQIAFDKLNDHMNQIGVSKFVSSVWSSDFLSALKTYPEIAVFRGLGTRQECGACRRGENVSCAVTFSGRPYDQREFEPTVGRTARQDHGVEYDEQEANKSDEGSNVDEDVDEDVDNDSSSSSSEDEQGDEITFQCGRHCQQNAEIAHTLLHWKKHMYEWFEKEMTEQGHLRTSQRAQRATWSEEKCRERANAVLDKMVENGQIGTLYDEYKFTSKSAREFDFSARNRFG